MKYLGDTPVLNLLYRVAQRARRSTHKSFLPKRDVVGEPTCFNGRMPETPHDETIALDLGERRTHMFAGDVNDRGLPCAHLSHQELYCVRRKRVGDVGGVARVQPPYALVGQDGLRALKACAAPTRLSSLRPATRQMVSWSYRI